MLHTAKFDRAACIVIAVALFLGFFTMLFTGYALARSPLFGIFNWPTAIALSFLCAIVGAICGGGCAHFIEQARIHHRTCKRLQRYAFMRERLATRPPSSLANHPSNPRGFNVNIIV
jgi:hypothetical protein